MSGPNFVIDKGFYVDPASSAVNAFYVAVFSTATQGDMAIAGDTVKAAGLADTFAIGLFQETLDATKVSTGKSVVGVRILGISRAVSDGSGVLAPGDKVMISAATAGQLKKVGTGTANQNIVGFAMSPAAAVAGTVFDCFLVPGGSLNLGVT